MLAQLSAAHQVRSGSGEFTAVLRQGPGVVGQLSQRLTELEAERKALRRPVADLMVNVARLNDNHIIVVGVKGWRGVLSTQAVGSVGVS